PSRFRLYESMRCWPATASPLTLSSAEVPASGAKTSSSPIGPAGLESISGQIWSLPFFSVNTTVVSSGAATEARLPSRDDGPFGSAIFSTRSNENFTSLEVRSLPLANFRPDLSLTVYSVGEVNSADSAMSGVTSAVPYLLFVRNG